MPRGNFVTNYRINSDGALFFIPILSKDGIELETYGINDIDYITPMCPRGSLDGQNINNFYCDAVVSYSYRANKGRSFPEYFP